MLAPAAAVFSILLIITGMAKIFRPHDVERALRELGAAGIPFAGVTIGIAEVVVGVGALFVTWILILQAVLYVVFAGWVLLALRSGAPIASCGCLGRDDTPPTGAHLLLNVTGTIVSSVAAAGTPLEFDSMLGGVATVVAISVAVFLAYVILTDAATLVGLRRQ